MTVTFQQMLTQHILRAQHKQEAQLSPGWVDCITYICRQASDFESQEESDFPE